jgi:hypothetical protein
LVSSFDFGVLRVKKYSCLTLVVGLALVGCSSVPNLPAQKPNDTELSCLELQTEFSMAQRLKVNAAKDKGFNQKNVAIAVLFWPALLATNSSASSAIAAADQRMTTLTNLMVPKDCERPEGAVNENSSDPVFFFKGTVVDRKEVASTETMMPVMMPGGGFITVPAGSKASAVLSVKDARGRIRSVATYSSYQVGACVEAQGPSSLPRGLLHFNLGELAVRVVDGCTD